MLDLSKQYQSIKEEILKAMDDVMSNSQFILGSNVQKLEQDIAAYSHVEYGIGVGNGSDAIHIALLAAGIGEGDEVITTPFTFFATAGSIVRAGAKPVFVDIDLVSFNIDTSKIEEAITEKTRAILPVHLYGQMANMDEINKIAQKHNLIVIEDAAQAIGALQHGKTVGETSHAATYSFFPTKNLGAYGDAGMIVTKESEIAEKAKIIRVHGSKPKYVHHVLGYNSRLDELQAAVLNVKLPYLTGWIEKRRTHANYYSQQLSSLEEAVTVPVECEGNFHIYHQYTLRVKNRDKLQSYLKEHGISSMVYYPVPLHLQPVFSDLGYKEGDFPVTEKAAQEAISLPMYPELTETEQNIVVQAIRDFYGYSKKSESTLKEVAQ